MIIINNPHDLASRRFVLEHGEGHTILDMADALDLYPAIPGGPCVPVHISAYRDPETGGDIKGYDWIYAFPADLAEVVEFIAMVDQRAIDNPYGGPV